MTSTQSATDLDQLTRALSRAWGPDTCAPEDRPQWSVDNPARGQCITTVLIVHDFFGGVLLRGEVVVGGEQVDYHWWNRLPDGTEIDLTRDQFGPDERVVGCEVIERPTGSHRVEVQYDRLKAAVLAKLNPANETV